MPADPLGDTCGAERRHNICGVGRAVDGQLSGGARLTHTYPCAGLGRCEAHHMCVHECPRVTERSVE